MRHWSTRRSWASGTAGFPALDKFAGYVVTLNGMTPGRVTSSGSKGPGPRESKLEPGERYDWLRGTTTSDGFQFVHISRLQKNNFGELLFNSVPTKTRRTPAILATQ